MKFCGNCGQQLNDNDKFCSSCGSIQNEYEISEDNQISKVIEAEDSILLENIEIEKTKDFGLSPGKAILYSCLTYLVYGCSSSYIFDWHVNNIMMYICEIVCTLIMFYFGGRVLTWREVNGKTKMSKVALWVCFVWIILFCWAFIRNLYAWITNEV